MKTADPRLLEEAQTEIENTYPGIQLESAVQGWAYLGNFDRGIDTYNALEAPSASDDRWLGVCFFQIFEDMRAQEAFFRALAKGEEAARVNLAHLLRFLERSEEAVAELLRVDVTKLSPYDVVLYLRVSSLHEETNGNIRQAVDFAEQAWEKVQGLPEYQILAPSVLAQLGILYGRMGEARRALWYFDRGIKLTDGLEQQKVKLRRATLLLNLGRFREVESELESLGELPEALNLEREFLRGELLWSKGQFNRSVNVFSMIVETAARLAIGSDEFASRLSLAAIHTRLENFRDAEENLVNARILISDKTDVLLHRFREILLHVRSRHYDSTEAASELEMLAVEFRSLGTLQEEACVRLHLADIFRRGTNARAELQLRAVMDICRTVHNTHFLHREWLLLPELYDLAQGIEPDLIRGQRSQLKVVTVGEENLYFEGTPVRLPMRRAVEILAYFLEVGEATLTRVVNDLFPTEKNRTARSYFHQFRHQIRQHLPGVEVSFDRRKKVYELRYDLDLVWDVASMRSGEMATAKGRFLPSAKGKWVEKVNLELRSRACRESATST